MSREECPEQRERFAYEGQLIIEETDVFAAGRDEIGFVDPVAAR
jgi:hypothetical protein